MIPPIADGQAWQFDYDGQLNRYKIDRAGTIRYLLWDGLNCMEERNVDGSLHARYTYGYTRIYGIGSCVEVYQPGAPDKTYTLVMDHRGTAVAILDEAGAEIGRRDYDAFGVILGQTGSWPTDLAYQTNWQTVQIGQKWWGLSAARMYDFVTGRFLQQDPIIHKKVSDSKFTNSSLGIYADTVFARSFKSKRTKDLLNSFDVALLQSRLKKEVYRSMKKPYASEVEAKADIMKLFNTILARKKGNKCDSDILKTSNIYEYGLKNSVNSVDVLGLEGEYNDFFEDDMTDKNRGTCGPIETGINAVFGACPQTFPCAATNGYCFYAIDGCLCFPVPPGMPLPQPKYPFNVPVINPTLERRVCGVEGPNYLLWVGVALIAIGVIGLIFFSGGSAAPLLVLA